MNNKSSKRWARCHVRGTTLVEVVAGLALLASVFAGLLAVKDRAVRQARVTETRRVAVSAADALLSAWWRDPPSFPRDGSGQVPGHPDLLWRTQTLVNAPAASLGGQVTRLELFSAPILTNEAPLATVEVMLPATQ